MDFFDFYDFSQRSLLPFADTARTPSWKKTTTSNHFDGFLTQFDEVLARHFPESNAFKTGGTTDRNTMMSFLVDKMRIESELLKQKITKARINNDDSYDVKKRCLTIAFRISAGEDVSPEDLLFLAEKDPELFARAMLDKKENDTPDKPTGQSGGTGIS